MKYRTLGQSGIQVSEIGFGCWGIGGWSPGQLSYGSTDDSESLRALDHALSSGITFFDTSCLYGLGHSERLIGKAIAGRRENVVIATKVGYQSYDDGPDFSPRGVRASLEQSLTRLGSDYVDVLQLHNPSRDDVQSNPLLIETLLDLKKEGKIRTFGASAKSPEDALVFVEDFGFPIVQVNFNMMDLRALSSGLYEVAGRMGTGIIARTPLFFGFLGADDLENCDFGEGDHRRRWDRQTISNWASGATKLKQITKVVGGTHVQRALRFCLSFAEVSTVIPGMLRTVEVEENSAASDMGALPEAVIKQIIAANEDLNFAGSGATR